MRNASYEEIAEKLRARHGNREQHEKFRVELKYRRRKVGESQQELSHDIERLATRAYPRVPHDVRDTLARDAFIEALDNRTLSNRVRERSGYTQRSVDLLHQD